jgi:hypothetical protein
LKKIFVFISLFTLLFSSSVFAHVANEKTLYDDIEFSQAKEEIVYLRGLDVIAYEHGTKLFKPQDKLKKADVAFWAASFKGLGGHDAKTEDLQKAAVENGLIDSLEGNATYADLNMAYFDGKAPVEKPESELTREDFALFMGQFLKEKVDGKTLFDMAGVEPGPTGVIEKVTVKEEGEGEKKTKIYWFTFEGKDYKVSPHPKMLYGPVDLTQWEGKKVGDPWLAGDGEEKMLQIVALEQGQFTDDEMTDQKPDDHTSPTNDNGNQNNEQAPDEASGNQPENDVAPEQPEKGFPVVPVVGGVVLVGILAWLMMKKKK